MKLFSLDAGRICECSNTMPTSAIVSKYQCNYPCAGEEASEGKCGGNYKMSVHAVTF